MAASAALGCPHCGNAVAAGAREAPFCCAGCREVYGLLRSSGLARYYDLGGGDGVPATPAPAERSLAWLEPLVAAAQARPQGLCSLELDVQGLHCAACVWLLDELFRRRGGASLRVNPALGRAHLVWEAGRFDVAAWVSEVERFGYLFGPARRTAERASRDLPVRLGICAAATMNVMLYSASFYLGLAPADGALFDFFEHASLALTVVVVAVGGWPFFKAAAMGLRRRLLHLDLPIAAGIVLAFGLSLVQMRRHGGHTVYFDTIDVFVTLMLVGRWLQHRMLERNRRLLLEDAGVDGLHVRRRQGERLEVTTAPRVRAGDELVVAPGDLVPVDAELLDETARISTDWINGESEPREGVRGGVLPAGSFNAGRSALRARAQTGFADSPLPGLLRGGLRGGTPTGYTRLAETLSRWYVPVVLNLAVLGGLWWWPRDPEKALAVVVALFVVTCPCALGLGIPLAIETALASLRRRGVFVRSEDLLGRAVRIRKVLFDKTGTLTLGRPELRNPQVLLALPQDALDALYDMAARSNHPTSRCLAQEATRAGARFSEAAAVQEHPGRGLELVRSVDWRLGSPAWAAPGHEAEGRTALSLDGAPIALFEIGESVRPDARDAVRDLSAAGLEVWLVSGDAPARAAAVARDLGIDAARVRAACSPEDKAALVQELDRGDTLFVGDGVNDALAFAKATATGTPAVDRPVMPARADFFLLGEGIGGVREVLVAARELRAAVRRLLVLAFTWNVLVVTVSLAGFMTPLRAAVAMPLGSLAVLLLAAGFSHAERRGTVQADGAPATGEAAWT